MALEEALKNSPERETPILTALQESVDDLILEVRVHVAVEEPPGSPRQPRELSSPRPLEAFFGWHVARKYFILVPDTCIRRTWLTNDKFPQRTWPHVFA